MVCYLKYPRFVQFYLGLPIAMRERDPDLLATEWGAEITEIAAPGTIDSMIASYNKWAQAVLLDGKGLTSNIIRQLAQADPCRNRVRNRE